MTPCHECGHVGDPAAGFCIVCGAAPQPPAVPVPAAPPSVHSRLTAFGVLGATVAVLAAIAGVTLVAPPTTAGRPAADVNHRPPTAATPTTTVGATSVTTSPPSSEPTDADTALVELNRQLDADRPAVEALVGQWVPQLSAKRPGLVAKGVRYDHVAILRDFRSTRARYPGALLLFSGEYSSFRHGDFWITVVPLPTTQASRRTPGATRRPFRRTTATPS